MEPPLSAFGLAHVLYACVLAIIYGLGRSARHSFQKKQAGYLLSTNFLLITFLAVCFFGFEAQRFLLSLAHFQLLPTVWALSLYLIGLGLYYKTSATNRKAEQQMRFLLPFALPLLFFTFILDLLFTESNPYLSLFSDSPLLFLATGFILTAGIMLVFPAIIQAVWQCEPLSREYPELAGRLEKLCKKAHFKHAGIKVWTVMNDSLTAAIIGIVPRFRYIMFTKKILNLLSPESIEAILAHEIGHSYRRHLLIYPLIILGMTLCLSVFGSLFEGHISPFIFFILYACTIGLYLRVIFGFFSRNFERQADLHVFNLDIQPKYMIEALHEVAVASGNIHLIPSWHHYSIQQRIDFLNEAIRNPSVIERHHRFVKKALIIYLVLLSIAIGVLWIF